MSDSNECKFDNLSSDSRSPIEGLLRRHGITEQEFDDVAQRRFNGFYPLAYKYFGISRQEVENMDKEVPAEIKPATKGGEKVFDSGVSVNRVKRALGLLAASDEYSKYSQLDGFEDTSHSPKGDEFRRKYGEKKVANIIGSKKTHLEKGDQEFHEAFGSRVMIENGEDPVEVEYDEQMQANKFKGIHIVTPYDDKETRAKKRYKKENIREALESQIK